MYARQVRRKCGVRGCKCTECFAISRNRENGNSVIICKSCLSEALTAIDEIDPNTLSNVPPIDNSSTPELFYNAKAWGKADDETAEDDNGEETVAAEDGKADASELICPVCGKEFESKAGLKTHLRYCKKETKDE